jgi:NitT/TauT family transport system substrate-binding protein
MRIMKHHDENPGSPLVCFAEIVCRDPFSIVGRYPNSGFRLADLARMRIATVSEVPTPWLCLQEDLRQAGIDPTELDRVADRNMAENLLALREGRIDAAQFFEPVVEEALALGSRSSLACREYPWPDYLHRLCHDQRPAGSRCRTATANGQGYPSGAAVDPRLLRGRAGCGGLALFPGARFRHADRCARPLPGARGMGRDPVLPEDGFDRLQNSLVSSGFTRRPVPYTACVDNRFARQVLAV